jgi:AhpD family alkylhydroperoxidase
MIMSQRFDVSAVAPEGYQAMFGLTADAKKAGLGEVLVELVKIRVSQINGCAFCLAMHVALGRKLGLTDDRMHLLAVWREAPVFSERERAALAWSEAVALLPGGDVPDAVYEEARRHFSERELAGLAMAVVQIGGWNRLMIASRTPADAS